MKFNFVSLIVYRKDSFITHRAFCDALADESSRLTSIAATNLSFGNAMTGNENRINSNFSELPHGFPGRRVQDIAGIPQQSGSLLNSGISGISFRS